MLSAPDANKSTSTAPKSNTADKRSSHPYYMYDHVQAQPDVFATAVQRNTEAAEQFAAESPSWRRLHLVGIGTSSHAAQVGEHIFRACASGLPVRAWHSFDFALYGPELSPDDAVVAISHRGSKHFTVAAVQRARQSGCRVALVTGEGNPPAADEVEAVLHTSPQEKSSAHTMSYVGAIAALSALAQRTALRRVFTNPVPEKLLIEEVPAALQSGLACESEMAAWARAHATRRRIWLVGGGPSAVTAQEIALKIKETSYLQVEGIAVETLLHGPLQCAEIEDVFVLIAPAGAAQARVVELGKMVREIGAALLVVSDGTPSTLQKGASGWCVVQSVLEPWSALTCLVPLQLFAYFLAIERGTNPDSFRLEDPRFAQAHGLVKL